jgi:Flp pilus assembly protein TadG
MKNLALFRLWQRLRTNRRGIAAMEFVAVGPMIALIFVGGFQVLDAVTVLRKLTDTTVQLANITSQYTSMSQADVNTVLAAASTIMTPYTTATMSIVLSEVSTDSNGNATVTWSKAFQGTPLTQGSPVTMPPGFDSPSTSYIMVQATYQYTAPIAAGAIGTIPMSKKIVMLPRGSASIPFTG